MKCLLKILLLILFCTTYLNAQNLIGNERANKTFRHYLQGLTQVYPEWLSANSEIVPITFYDLNEEPFLYFYDVQNDAETVGYCAIGAFDDLPPLIWASSGKSPLDNFEVCKNRFCKSNKITNELQFSNQVHVKFISNALGIFCVEFSFDDNSFYYDLVCSSEISLNILEEQQTVVEEFRLEKSALFKADWQELDSQNPLRKISGTASANELNVTAFTWYRGCGPTSQAMVLKYLGETRPFCSPLDKPVTSFSWSGPTNWTTTRWEKDYNPSNSNRYCAKSLVDRFADHYDFPESGGWVSEYGSDKYDHADGFCWVAWSYSDLFFSTGYSNPSSSKLKTEIDNNRPVKGGFITHPTYGTHAVCIIGYTGDGSTATFWDTYQTGEKRSISSSAFDNFVYCRPNIRVPTDVSSLETALSMTNIYEGVVLRSGCHTLNNDLILNNRTLWIESGATLDLNSYSIRCIGNALIINDDGVITGDYSRIQRDNTYKGLFPASTTMYQLMDWASVNYDVVLKCGTYNLNDNLSVENGIDLVVGDAATINLSNNYYLICEGSAKIEKNGSINGYTHYAKNGSYWKAFFPSGYNIQQMIDLASGSWDLYPQSDTYNQDLSMKSNISIIGPLTISGKVHFNNVSGCELKHVTVRRIEVDGGSNNKASFINFSSSSTSIDVDGYADFNFYDIDTNANYFGINARNHSIVDGESAGTTMSTIYDCSEDGVSANSSATVYLGKMDFCNNGCTDIYAGSGCYVNAEDVLHFTCDPDECDCVYGNVDLPSGGYLVCLNKRSIAKENPQSSIPDNESISAEDENPVKNAYLEARTLHKNIKIAQFQEKEEKGSFDISEYKSEYDALFSKANDIVLKNPDDDFAVLSMNLIYNCFNVQNLFDESYNYFSNLAAGKSESHLRPHAMSALVAWHTDRKNYKQALALTEDILTDYPKSELAPDMLLAKGKIYLRFLDEQEKAVSCFNRILSEYPENKAAFAAKTLLEEIESEQPKPSVTSSGNEITIQNYPNPFNPDTEIRYSLPEAGQVSLKIFDIQGREVITLFDEEQTAGNHTLKWNGLNRSGLRVASGMYFYQIRFNRKVLTKKMVVVR